MLSYIYNLLSVCVCEPMFSRTTTRHNTFLVRSNFPSEDQNPGPQKEMPSKVIWGPK